MPSRIIWDTLPAMIQSMTAFARESTTTDQGILTVELRSVNHRYLDCSFKLPDALRPLEPRLRENNRERRPVPT